MGRKIPVIILALLLICACGNSREDHREVARTFVYSFHKYVSESKSYDYSKLVEISSDYTLELIESPETRKTLILGENFKYVFIRDSITPDKMRAFVWYANELQVGQKTVCRLPLRQSLHGWIVDLPII